MKIKKYQNPPTLNFVEEMQKNRDATHSIDKYLHLQQPSTKAIWNGEVKVDRPLPEKWQTVENAADDWEYIGRRGLDPDNTIAHLAAREHRKDEGVSEANLRAREKYIQLTKPKAIPKFMGETIPEKVSLWSLFVKWWDNIFNYENGNW